MSGRAVPVTAPGRPCWWRAACAAATATSRPSTASTSSCAPGESVALLGPNGAGKTTLLTILAGVGRAERGHRRLGRRAWPRASAGCPSGPSLYPRLTTRENLRLFAALEKARATRTRPPTT